MKKLSHKAICRLDLDVREARHPWNFKLEANTHASLWLEFLYKCVLKIASLELKVAMGC